MKKIDCIGFISLLSFFLTTLQAQPYPYQDSTLSVTQRVDDLLGRMTQDEKIGQLMQVDLSVPRNNPAVLVSYAIGSVLSGGGSAPAAGNAPVNWADAYDTVQSYALQTRLGIPLIYGIDAVHGHNNVYGATIFPHNIGLGCTHDPQLVREAARITAIEVAATGIDWTFSPCIAVPRNERWGRTYEGFSEAPELVQLLGSSAVRGYQGDSLSDPLSILACAKQYLGDGGTTGGTDQGNTQADTATVRRLFLPGYISAVDSGVGSVMVSFSSINGQKMSASKFWITDVLKNELGFNGFVVSDWAAIDQLTSNYQDCVDQSINAGIDMVMLPYKYDAFRTAMRNLLSQSKITGERLDDAVRRILAIKFRLGLFERPYTDRSLLPLVGSPDHRAVARRCVRESIVLLKKKDGILPLRKTGARILVAGSNANDIGNQCGGWTISWQGQSGAITEGTTILQGMQNVASGDQIEYSKAGTFSDTVADYSVVVIGETPYAESVGDKSDLHISQTDVNLVKKMKGYGAPVVVVLVSGRPMILDAILHYADAIFAAWLPGTEGGGVADVLFGDYQPTGRLSYTWPKSMAQIPINVGDSSYSPLYAYGYGIDTLGNSPVGSSPKCLSAIVTPDGQKFELTFNKPMKDPSSAQASFVFTRNGLQITSSGNRSLKQNDSTTIVVELDGVIYSRNDTATVSYASGTLEAADGGVLQPFDSVDVYNWSQPSTGIVGGTTLKPLATRLDGIYPNPFNPSTLIDYQLPVTSRVTLKIYDVLGRQVAILVDGQKEAGYYTAQFVGSKIASGVYFARFIARPMDGTKQVVQTQKMVLMK
jgi:beta-glucosidase